MLLGLLVMQVSQFPVPRLEADLVASAAKKKVDSSSSIPPSWSIQRAEAQMLSDGLGGLLS